MRPSLSTADLAKLVDTITSAAKGAEGGDAAEEGRALDGLRALRKQAVNTKLLSDTQAGKRIRALSKHPNAEIAKLAAEVVGAWKELVRRESEATPSSSQQAGAAAAAERPSQPGSQAAQPGAVAAPAKSEGARSEGGGGSQLERRPSSSQATSGVAGGGTLAADAAAQFDAGAVAKTGDPVRDKCRLNFGVALQMAVLEGSAGAPGLTAVAVENELFKSQGGVSAGYKAKFRALHFNMKDEKNPDLRRKVLTGEIAPDTLMTLPPEELASDAKKEENAQIREKKLFHSQRGAQKQATTDQFQCGKCRQRKCTYYQMQTRSADEPMTTFVTCLNCNNRWKFC